MTDKPFDTTYADLFDPDRGDGFAPLIEDLDALYGAPTPPANMQARFEHLLRQRTQPMANGRVTSLSGAMPPASRGMLPLAHPEPTTIPLPVRTGAQARLRQVAGIAAAVLVFVLVAIMLAQIFGAGSDDVGQQAAPVDATPTPTMGEILFVGEDEAGTRAIYVANFDGSGVRQITEGTQGRNDWEPVWSPDGTRIAYSSDIGGEHALYVMHVDGGDHHRISDSIRPEMWPAWSPDGARIAFTRYESDRVEIIVANAEGTELRSLTNGKGGVQPIWSPDGTKLVYVGFTGNASMNLFVINTDGSDARQLTTTRTWVHAPTWSPDGTRILFFSDMNGPSAIYVIDVDGSNLTKLTDVPADYHPAWSPDGREIAFTRGASGVGGDADDSRIYVMNADGSNQRMLVDIQGVAPAWSPDGSQIAFIRSGVVDPATRPELYVTLHVVNRDGSGHRVLAENVAVGSRIAWRPTAPESSVPEPVPTPTPTPAPTPTPPPLDDLTARASRSPFPDAEVLHVVQIAEQGPDAETHTVDTWIDQTTGDFVVWQTTMDGEPRSLAARQGTTVIRAEKDGEVWRSLNITTMLRADDPYPALLLDHLNGFRDLLTLGTDELDARGITVNQDATYDGQPAVELIIPVRDGGQVVITSIAYLDPETLYPIAILHDYPDERFPDTIDTIVTTVEPLALADVPAGTFDPPLPEAIFTYINEAIAPEAASDFNAYPLWWLGVEFSGYTLHSIERYRSTTPDNDQTDRDTVTALYLAGPDNFDDQLQIISQPPLSDIEWAHRDANHNVHGYEELEIDGHRAWLHPDGSQMEIAFPDSYVTISAPNLALPAAEALQQANAPVDLSEEAITAAIAALPENERGCGATPVGIREDMGRDNQVQGRTVIGDPDTTVLLMQYSTLDDDSPRAIRVGQSVRGYWVVDGQTGPLRLVSLVNLDTGLSSRPDSGVIEGQGAWRPAVWFTIITFPEPGCWQAVVTRGDGAAVLWIDVQPSLDDLAVPVTTAEDFTAVLTSLQPGEARRVTLSVTTDYRLDEGALNAWTVTIWDRVLPNGREQRHMAAYDAEGNRVAWFVRDGAFWHWGQRGWHETGSMAAGIVMMPEELRLADERVQLLGSLLDGSSDARAMGGREEGGTTVTNYWFPGLVEMAERLNLRVDGIVHEVWHTTSSGVPFRAQTGVATPDGNDLLLDDITFDVARYPAEALDDTLFELVTGAMVSHRYWGWATLPHDLSIELLDAQVGGPPTGSELHTITGDGIDLQLEVFPSRGGHDPRTMTETAAQDGLTATVTETRAGPVTWLARPGDGWPIRAIWDDGSYRFDLQGDLRGRTEADLIALVEALSAGALR